ncbi:MAG TPA: serine/threonine-protein kinase [Kofleriaceae bacterium]|nr:serine/threonine-protein kinase [Kofleriaceae bacterium]
MTGSASGPGPAPGGEGPLGGRFEIGAQVGGGLTGEVFQARDVQSGAACAVKLVHAHVFPNQLMLQRAERELKQLERVQLSEVGRVLAHGRKADRLWIALEWIDGVPLDRLVAQSGPMPPARAAALVRSVAQGLAEVAKQGVIHRDLAAKNILVGAGDQVKVINFSVAAPSSDMGDKVQGVPEFLSPEQIDGKPADQRSSIYSLGALLYFAVTGRPPFTGDPQTVHQAHQHGEVVRPSQVAGAPPALDAIVMKAMEKHSARRFMTLHQLMTELDGFSSAGAAAHVAVAHHAKGMAPAPAGATLMGVSGFGPPPGAQVPAAPLFDAPPMAAPQMAAHQVPIAPSLPVAPPVAPPMQPTMLEGQAPQGPVVISKASLPPSASLPNMPTTGGGGKKKGKGGGAAGADSKGKFRETMWFKKGELDEAAAAAAAAAQEGELALDKADALPIEDRYKDDGTLSRQDAERLSLRTGATSMMQAVRDPNAAAVSGRRGKGLSEDDLVGEMKQGRGLLVFVIILILAALGGLVAYFATS